MNIDYVDRCDCKGSMVMTTQVIYVNNINVCSVEVSICNIFFKSGKKMTTMRTATENDEDNSNNIITYIKALLLFLVVFRSIAKLLQKWLFKSSIAQNVSDVAEDVEGLLLYVCICLWY